MNLERQQSGIITSVYDLRIFDGQHGEGCYFHMCGDAAMIDYYSRSGESSCIVSIPNELVLNCTNKNYEYWDARKVIFDNPNKKAFIFNHSGTGIPKSKEILVTDVSFLKLL